MAEILHEDQYKAYVLQVIDVNMTQGNAGYYG